MVQLTQAQKNCQIALDTATNCTIIKSIRSGKTLTILDYAKKKKYKSILWVVPYIVNIQGIHDEMKKWKINLNVTAICYGSIKKQANKQFDLVVLDECHRITPVGVEELKKASFQKLIAMTGTYPKNITKQILLENDLGLEIVFRYSIKDAINDGNVAPYVINIVRKKLSEDKTLLVNTLKHNFHTSEEKSHQYLLKTVHDNVGKRKMIAIFSLMRFLNTLPSTIEYIKKYIDSHKDKRFLVFVATQEMAEKCSEYCYYGGKDDKYFKLFHEEKINHLVLVEKATVGVTYENLNGCLLTSINGSNSSVLQKIFRTVLFRPNYTANIDILVTTNTKQEEWIQKALSDI